MDIWKIADKLLKDDVFTKRLDRGYNDEETVVKDLYVDGLIHLSKGQRIAKLKHDMMEERDIEHPEDKAARLKNMGFESSVETSLRETDDDDVEDDTEDDALLQLDYINETFKAMLVEGVPDYDW